MSEPVNNSGSELVRTDNDPIEAWCRIVRSYGSPITIWQDRKAFLAINDTPADKKEDTHRE